MSTAFAKHMQSDGSHRWWQAVPGRYVDPGQYQLVEWIAAGGVPDEVPYVAPDEPAPEVPTLSKLGLRLACRRRGLEELLDAMLTGTAAKEWADATVLRADYPLVAAVLPLFQSQAGLTDEELAVLIEEAKA